MGTLPSACGRQGNTCAACPFGTICDNGLCQPPLFDGGTSGLPTGSACSVAQQCAPPGSGQCITAWPGGSCTSLCGSGMSCGLFAPCPGACPAGGTCVGLAANTAFCTQSCGAPGAGQSSCRPGYVCTFATGSMTVGFCAPDCRSFGCITGGTCNQATGYCQ
jgi:hypothetical protein